MSHTAIVLTRTSNSIQQARKFVEAGWALGAESCGIRVTGEIAKQDDLYGKPFVTMHNVNDVPVDLGRMKFMLSPDSPWFYLHGFNDAYRSLDSTFRIRINLHMDQTHEQHTVAAERA